MNKNEKTFFSFSVSLLELLESDIPLKNSLEVLSSETSINKNVKKGKEKKKRRENERKLNEMNDLIS